MIVYRIFGIFDYIDLFVLGGVLNFLLLPLICLLLAGSLAFKKKGIRLGAGALLAAVPMLYLMAGLSFGWEAPLFVTLALSVYGCLWYALSLWIVGLFKKADRGALWGIVKKWLPFCAALAILPIIGGLIVFHESWQLGLALGVLCGVLLLPFMMAVVVVIALAGKEIVRKKRETA